MSGSEAAKVLARQDKLARAEARKAKQARQEAREAAARAKIEAEQQRLVAEAKAARERGEIPADLSERKWRPGKAGRSDGIVRPRGRSSPRDTRAGRRHGPSAKR